MVINDIDSVPSNALAIYFVETSIGVDSFQGVVLQASNLDCLCRANRLNIAVEAPVGSSFGVTTYGKISQSDIALRGEEGEQ